MCVHSEQKLQKVRPQKLPELPREEAGASILVNIGSTGPMSFFDTLIICVMLVVNCIALLIREIMSETVIEPQKHSSY